MEYFGTNLSEHVHYRWVILNGALHRQYTKFDDLPFHPEYLTDNMEKGEVSFYQSSSYSVIAINGSPKDERPGSKSVFWEKEKLSREDLIKRIKENETAMALIDAMPFVVLW